MPQNLLLTGLERLEQFVNPLRHLVSGDPVALLQLERQTGWIFLGDLAALTSAVQALVTAADAIVAQAVALRDDELPDLGALADLGRALADLIDSVDDGLRDALGLADEPALRDALLADMRDLLLLNDLARRSPAVYAVLSALGLIEHTALAPRFTRDGRLARRGIGRPCLYLDRLGPLLRDPKAHLKALYVPASASFDDEAARRFLCRLCDQLEPLARIAGARLQHHSSPVPAAALPDLAVLLGRDDLDTTERDALARQFRSASFLWTVPGPVAASLGARIEVLPAGVRGGTDITGPGVELALLGGITHTVERGPWHLTASVEADVELLGVTPTRVSFGQGTPRVSPRVDIAYEGPFVVGGKVGPRLELAAVRGHLFATLGEHDEMDAGFGLALDDLAFIVSPGEDDAFLATILPSLSLRLSAELAWSLRGGLRLGLEAGLAARIPVNIRLGSVIEIPYLDLAVDVAGAALAVSVRGPVLSKLGPISLAVDGLGVEAAVDLAAPRSSRIKPLPPTEIGISVVVPDVLKALGKLILDIPAGRYGGAVAISTPWFEAAAIGVITTRDPWSFFISMGAIFTPAIQLGYGFMLSGVGGLFAVNRELDPPGMIAALRAGSLRAVLFPRVDKVIEHIDEILELVDTIFPVKQGSFVFGPMLMIDWGAGPVLRAVLGVLVSLPSPLRIALIGQFGVKLPPMKEGEEVKPLIDLNMDVVGIIDFGTGIFSLDGRLYDSTLLSIFKLSGDIAFRAYFRDNPGFLLSVGGFHPSFEPPADVGPLERMTMSFEKLKNEDKPEDGAIAGFALKSYFALTPNTVQMGARFDFWVHVLGLTVDGGAGFNAILWFKPFRLEFDTNLCVSVRRGERRLMGIELDLHVTGPKPWHLWGSAGFDFFGLECHASFDVTLKAGDGDTGELDKVAVAELVRHRLGDGRAWTARPGRVQSLVLRPAAGSNVVLLTLDQSLECQVHVVPLAREIQRFGGDIPGDAVDRGPFSVPAVVLHAPQGDIKVTPTTELDWFAPAKFENLSHDATLTRPSFERMKGRVVVDGGSVYASQPAVVDTEQWSDMISEPDDQGGFRMVPKAG